MSADEEWRAVLGYEGLYEVSSHGRIRSLDRVSRFVDGRVREHKGRMLQPATNRYQYIFLFPEKGPRKKFPVHGLVLAAFRGPRPSGEDRAAFGRQPSEQPPRQPRVRDAIRQHA